MYDRILILRKDNIGDLVCTTPLIRSLRKQCPDAQIDALVTRYNRAVLEHNPHINNLYAYQKAKHRQDDESRWSVYFDRVKIVSKLRATKYDWIVLPGGATGSAGRFADWAKPKNRVIRDANDQKAGIHEVHQICNLLPRMGLEYETPELCLVADPNEKARYHETLSGEAPLIGLHISARKPSQRWPAERFAAVAKELHKTTGARFALFWSPGAADNSLHPGDDAKAQVVLDHTGDVPITPVPTSRLEELIAALDHCDSLICADGGAMHLAAGLGKPIVCLFGDSDAEHWHPWSVSHQVVRTPSRDVNDVSAEMVMKAIESLQLDAENPGSEQ